MRLPRPADSPGRGGGVRPQRPGRKVGDCACIRMQDLGVFQERGVASKEMGCSFDPSGGSVRDPPQELRVDRGNPEAGGLGGAQEAQRGWKSRLCLPGSVTRSFENWLVKGLAFGHRNPLAPSY